MHRADLKQKLLAYNEYHQDTPGHQVKCSNEEGDQCDWILEGILRIHWGIVQPIRFRISDESRTDVPDDNPATRYSCDETSQLDLYMNLPRNSNSNIETVLESPTLDQSQPLPLNLSPPQLLKLSNNVARSQSSVVMRKNRKKKVVKKRLSIINGHLFSAQTSMFTPTLDSCTNVFVTNHHNTHLVIKLLLNKFKVDNSPSEFCLCAIRSSGETVILKDSHAPLVERLLYGPMEDQVKMCLIEKYRVMHVNEEAAHFFGLPDLVLDAFLTKYTMDEKLEMQMIKEKYKTYKEKLEEIMEPLEPTA